VVLNIKKRNGLRDAMNGAENIKVAILKLQNFNKK